MNSYFSWQPVVKNRLHDTNENMQIPILTVVSRYAGNLFIDTGIFIIMENMETLADWSSQRYGAVLIGLSTIVTLFSVWQFKLLPNRYPVPPPQKRKTPQSLLFVVQVCSSSFNLLYTTQILLSTCPFILYVTSVRFNERPYLY